MHSRRNILVVSTGEFSGTKNSLVNALKEQGCSVSYVRHSLRRLSLWRYYKALMYGHAFIRYGLKARRYLNRTPTAGRIFARAAQAIMDSQPDIDAVIFLQGIYPNFHPNKSKDISYCIYTDHVNLLSKKNPDFGHKAPERKVHHSWNEIERSTLKDQDYIFVMGEHVRECMIEDYGVFPDRVFAIGAGPNLDVDVERDIAGKDFSQRNVLFVGLDGERKGLPTLTKAFETVHAEFHDARLHVVGVNGQSNDGIIYYGRVVGDSLKDLFYASQIFAMPAWREPFGIVFLEAMWSKMACIGTRVGALPEIIDEGRTGFLVAPGDHKMLANRVISLFRHPERLREMAEAGYRKAEQRYRWSYCAQRIVDVLNGGSVMSARGLPTGAPTRGPRPGASGPTLRSVFGGER